MSDKIPNNWWTLLENVEHDWGEVEIIRPYDDDRRVQFCTMCNAMRHAGDDSEAPSTPQFESCRYTTDYPADDSPCLCTRSSYLRAHGII